MEQPFLVGCFCCVHWEKPFLVGLVDQNFQPALKQFKMVEESFVLLCDVIVA